MARTTPNNVKAILGQEYDSVNLPSLNPFIDTASVMVDEVQADDYSGLMTSQRLEIVERWLAAHFYQISDPGYKSRSTSKANGTFNGETAQGLKGTRYGQQAMFLDLTGFLARRDKEATDGSRRMIQLICPRSDSDYEIPTYPPAGVD